LAVTGQPDLDALDAKSCGQDAQHRRLVIHDKNADGGTELTLLDRWLGRLPCPAQVEEPVQFRDRKDLLDLRTQVANGHVPPPGEQLLTRSPGTCRLPLHTPGEARLPSDWGSGTGGPGASAGAPTAPATRRGRPRPAPFPLHTP